MKSQVDVYLLVMAGLRKDVLATYPALRGVDLDFERISLNCRSRGLTYFMLDLPSLDSCLTAGLREGRLIAHGPASKLVSKRIRVPRLFAGLWLRVFDKDACLRLDADETAVAFLRQLLTLGKKLQVECSEQRKKAAYDQYHIIEHGLRRPTLSWDSDRLDTHSIASDLHLADHNALGSFGLHDLYREDLGEEGRCGGLSGYLLEQCQIVADIVVGSLPFFEPVSFSEREVAKGRGPGQKHGPGAVAERLKGSEKFEFPNWTAKLEEWFPRETFGTINPNFASEGGFVDHEPGSRLLMVPKTAKGPRIIACEPVAHQWCQQLTLNWLVRRIRKSWLGQFVDFRDQQASASLVTQASLDGKLATVDLSDASDRLTCWTVERMLRRNQSLLHALHAARTRWLRTEWNGVRDDLKLKKFASQGTAVTFPIQSLVFLIIALTSCIEGTPTLRKLKRLAGQVRVYGDDIILPTRGYGRLRTIMEALELKVNPDKSFDRGYFRESCGQDSFKGFCVTPVKPKFLVADGPASCQAVIDTTNNLFNKGYWHASNSLRSTLPVRVQHGQPIVGIRDAEQQGFTSFCGSDERHLKKRWCRRLHRYEVRVCRLSVKREKRPCDGPVALFAYFAKRRVPCLPNIWEARVTSQQPGVEKVKIGLLWVPSSTAVIRSVLVRHERLPHQLCRA